MIYTTDWKGNTRNKSGIATFNCGNNSVKIRMSSFDDYFALCSMLDTVGVKTELNTKAVILEKVHSAIMGKI